MDKVTIGPVALYEQIKTLISLKVCAPILLVLAGCEVDSLSITPPVEENPEVDESIENWRAPELTSSIYKSSTARTKCVGEKEGVTYADPIPVILEMAKSARVVMINESHAKPLHRLFIGELAKNLSKNGYSIYAAETFNQKVVGEKQGRIELIQRGYPLIIDGHYTKEPVYGQILESIIELGYDLRAYETQTTAPPSAYSDIEYRDMQQAINLKQIIDNQPNKKILVHTGYHHVLEVEGKLGNTWLAKAFKEISGINPLTIGQTECYSESSFDGGLLGYAVALKDNGMPMTFKGYDVTLIPPKETYENERPTWLKEMGRKFIKVPLNLQFDDRYTFISAQNIDRSDMAVVEDEIYRSPKSDIMLALRPGNYLISVEDKSRNIIAQEMIHVEPLSTKDCIQRECP